VKIGFFTLNRVFYFLIPKSTADTATLVQSTEVLIIVWISEQTIFLIKIMADNTFENQDSDLSLIEEDDDSVQPSQPAQPLNNESNEWWL